MDLIYDDGSKDLSLQSLTTTIIIQKILEDEGMLENCATDEKTITSRATEVVNNLPLPSTVKWQLRRMVLPIKEEMQSWYQYKDKASRVVLTQNGTVDLPRSLSDMLNDKNVSLIQRFKVACDHCLEQEIFDIGAQINFPNYFFKTELKSSLGYWIYDKGNLRSLGEIWYKIYKGNFHAKLGINNISEDYCKEGFLKAFNMLNSAGLKYFLEGTSLSEISDHFLSNWNAISFTPDVCIKIFKRLNEDKGQRLKSCFASQLLKCLLKWPFQNQFLKAAMSLVLNIKSTDFWLVAALIINKARHDYEDHDYKDLFFDFWKLGNDLKKRFIEPADCARRLLYDVILMQDKRLTHFVLDNTTEGFTTHYVFNCNMWYTIEEIVCLRLIFEKHFEALELFMGVCRVNNYKFIVQFQKDVLEYSDPGAWVRRLSLFYCPSIGNLDKEELENILREFLSRMEKLKPRISEISILEGK